MANPVLILLIVVIAALIGVQILGKRKGKSTSRDTTEATVSNSHAASSTLRDRNGTDIMRDLRQKLESLTAAVGKQPAGDGPQAHVVQSLALITAKLQDLEQRVRKMEQRADREAHQRQMYEK